jgi:hypothetical protein
MNNNTTINKILQEVIVEKEIEELSEKHKYAETARKATASTVFRYQMAGSMEESSSYRELEIDGMKHGLVRLDHTTLSRKGKEIPYEIALDLLELTMERANRARKRKITKEYSRFVRAFDTTFLIDQTGRWGWSPYRDGKSGIKAHISYRPETGLPDKFNIGKVLVGDTEHLEEFCRDGADGDCIVADRGYLSVAKFCSLDDSGQDFIIRIPERVNLVNPVTHDFKTDSKYTDILCCLGKDHGIPAKYRKRQFRVISFLGNQGKQVTLCTNIYSLTADEIAELYRMRWNVEVFFKTLKQNFSLKKIFGKSLNSVFTQVIINFLTYIVLFSVFSVSFNKFSFLTFLRLLRADILSSSIQFCCFVNST